MTVSSILDDYILTTIVTYFTAFLALLFRQSKLLLHVPLVFLLFLGCLVCRLLSTDVILPWCVHNNWQIGAWLLAGKSRHE